MRLLAQKMMVMLTNIDMNDTKKVTREGKPIFLNSL